MPLPSAVRRGSRWPGPRALATTQSTLLGLLGVAAATPVQQLQAPPPGPAAPAGFDAAHPGWRVVGPQVSQARAVTSEPQCASTCLAKGTAGCIAFNWVMPMTAGGGNGGNGGGGGGGLCELSGWGAAYAVNRTSQGSVYYTRTLPRNDTAVRPKVEYRLVVPTSGVEITGGPFATAFASNLAYLAQFPVRQFSPPSV